MAVTVVLPLIHAWVIQPAAPSRLRAVAGLCIDEFEKLPMPLFPMPGWKARAREEAITQWSMSREALLAGSLPHALLIAERDKADAGRFFEGIEDGLLGFAELGLLPAPPEKQDEVLDGARGPTIKEQLEADAAEPPLYPYLANLAVQAGESHAACRSCPFLACVAAASCLHTLRRSFTQARGGLGWARSWWSRANARRSNWGSSGCTSRSAGRTTARGGFMTGWGIGWCFCSLQAGAHRRGRQTQTFSCGKIVSPEGRSFAPSPVDYYSARLPALHTTTLSEPAPTRVIMTHTARAIPLYGGSLGL